MGDEGRDNLRKENAFKRKLRRDGKALHNEACTAGSLICIRNLATFPIRGGTTSGGSQTPRHSSERVRFDISRRRVRCFPGEVRWLPNNVAEGHDLVTLQMLSEEPHHLVVHSHMEGPAIEPFGVRANRDGLQKTTWREEGCMACARDRVELNPRPKRFLN